MDTRPDEPERLDRAGRVFIVLAVVCSLAAIGIGSVWIVGSTASPQTILDVADAQLPTPPTTVAPLATEPPPAPVSTAVREAAPASTLPSLAAQLGPRYSVIPDEIEPRPRPVRLTTSSIDVADYPIRDVGLEPDGQLEVPDETEIGWYRYGATAGRAGATVLAAHVSWNRTLGPFSELGAMEPGDTVTVTLDDGTTRQYIVTERTMYDKNELPRERIWRTTGDESLVLITCGGDFNPEIRRFRQNIVVYAAPVA